MKYLIVDAELSGTGVRDKYLGGYIDPEDLALSAFITFCTVSLYGNAVAVVVTVGTTSEVDASILLVF
jgi:hypothetical protein